MAFIELQQYLPKDLLDHIINKYLMPSKEDMVKQFDKVIKQYKSAVLGPVLFVSGDPEDDDNMLTRFTRLGLLKTIMKNSQVRTEIEDSDKSDSGDDSDTSSDLEVAKAIIGHRHRNCCHSTPEQRQES